jgi:hypothetical protein
MEDDPPVARTTPSGLTADQRLAALEQRVGVLESERPGRKPMPLLAVRQRGVCAINPDSDSKTCEFASIYRYQSGCHGDACRLKQHQAYERRKTRPPATKVSAKKAPATRRSSAKTAKAAAPTNGTSTKAKKAAVPRKSAKKATAVTKKVSKRVAA